MELVEAGLNARKHRESCLYHCGGSMKFVQAWLSARKHREISFNHRGEPLKHMEACISAMQERSRKQCSPLWSFCEARAGLFKCGKGPTL